MLQLELLAEVLIIGLASWRIAALLSYERGPFHVFLKLRSVLGFTHDENGQPDAWPDGFFPELISCVWCLSLWIAAGMWGVWQISEPVVIIVAASSVILSVEKWNRG